MGNRKPMVISSADGRYQLTGFPLRNGHHKGFFITQINIDNNLTHIDKHHNMSGCVISTETRNIYHTFSGWTVSDRDTDMLNRIYRAVTNLESELTTYLGDFDPNTLQGWFIDKYGYGIDAINSMIDRTTVNHSKALDTSLFTSLL